MYRFLHPFLYNELLDQVLTDPALNRVLLYGGRGLGKTTLLRRAQRRLIPGAPMSSMPPDDLPKATWIDKTTKNAQERIVAWCEKPKGTLLVDDFASLFTAKIDDAILDLEDVNDAEFRLLAMSLNPPRILEAGVIDEKRRSGAIQSSAWDDSRAIPTFISFRLDPWQGDWRQRLETTHLAALGRLGKFIGNSANGSPPDRANDKLPMPSTRVLKLWVEVVREVTGGHPILVDGAFDLFTGLVLNELISDGWLQPKDAAILPLRKRCRWASELTLPQIGLGSKPGRETPSDVRREVRALVEDYLLDRQMVHLEHTMNFLRASKPDAFVALHSLATDPDDTIIDDPRHRQVLLDSGLTYKNLATRRLTLPIGLIRTTLRSLALPGEAEPSVEETRQTQQSEVEVLSLTVTGEASGKAGKVRLETTSGLRTVPLRGRLWEVFDHLWKQQGQCVSAKGLMKPLGFLSVHSALDAIRRLRVVFEDVGAPGVVENVRAVGYRVVAPDGPSTPESAPPS